VFCDRGKVSPYHELQHHAVMRIVQNAGAAVRSHSV
jgi:hypothetical protein